jgi:hypothetical protein
MRGKHGSSLPGVLGGLTVLIFTGMGLSALMQHRMRLSAGTREMREQIETDELQIGSLRSLQTRLDDQFEAKKRAAADQTQALQGANRLSLLRTTANGLRQECATLDAEFSRYRTVYRSRLWQQAEGETLGVLRLTNGREFTGVSIVRVTDGAMEIAHHTGRTRISARDLPLSWSTRFQWDK